MWYVLTKEVKKGRLTTWAAAGYGLQSQRWSWASQIMLATPIFGKIPENSAKGLDASLGPWPRPFIWPASLQKYLWWTYKGTKVPDHYHHHITDIAIPHLWCEQQNQVRKWGSTVPWVWKQWGIEECSLLSSWNHSNHGLYKKGRACLWGPCHVKRASGDFCIFSFIRWQTVASGYQGVLPIITKSSWG